MNVLTLSLRRVLAIFIVASVMTACGKKGPPLPPLVRVPTAPPDFTAERRGDEVRLQFTVPSTNTDGTQPANIDRIDVYAFTGPTSAKDEQLIALGTKVASVTVKAPKNPDVTTEPEEEPEEPDLTEEGIDQGAVAQVEESLTDASFTPVQIPKQKDAISESDEPHVDGPLVGTPSEFPRRIFIAVGVNTRGKKGPPSKRIIVPLVTPPLAPPAPTITYSETAVSLKWTPSPSWAPIQAAPAEGDGLLPARFFGIEPAAIAYHVYDVSPEAADAPGAGAARPATLTGEARLTSDPVSTTAYEDKRIDWGKTRCYAVRTLETIAGQTLESEAQKPACVTLKDTFAPAAPKNLQQIAGQGSISLIWEPNSESDVAGYLVLRGAPPGNKLEPVTPAPVTATVFDDKVAVGVRYVYAVQAVDRAGNISPLSNLVEEMAR